MAKLSWGISFLILISSSSTSDAFARMKRSANDQGSKPLTEVIPEQLIEAEAEKPADNIQDPSHVRKRRQWNEVQTTIQEIFQNPLDQTRTNRHAYQYQPSNYPNMYNPPQVYNKFPVYGPPSFQPSNFIPNTPTINNHYLPYQPPIFCQYYIIRLPSYIPQVPNRPTGTTPSQTPGLSLDDRFNNEGGNRPNLLPEIDESAYNNTLTGISLDVIKPVRKPSVTAPPIERPESDAQGGFQGPPSQQRPSRPLPRPTPRPLPPPRPTQPPYQRPTQIPQNSYPSNSVNPSYPIYYPTDDQDDRVSQDLPSNVDENSSLCVRAIAWCCVPNRARRIPRERCFEINGCPGAFFDSDPCDSALAIEAIRATNQFRRRG